MWGDNQGDARQRESLQDRSADRRIATGERNTSVRHRQQRFRLITRAPPGDVVPDIEQWECDGWVLVGNAGVLEAIPA